MKLLAVAVSVVAAIAAVPPAKQLPPPGVPVPEADQTELRAGLDKLGARIQALKDNPNIADVEVYHKAVRYALDGNEFFKPEEIYRAKLEDRYGESRRARPR